MTKPVDRRFIRVLDYWRDGSLWRRIGRRLFRRRPVQTPALYKVHWYGADSEDEAARALIEWGVHYLEGHANGWVLCPGAGDELHDRICDGMRASGVEVLRCGAEGPADATRPSGEVAAVICAFRDSRSITRTAASVRASVEFREVPFEYAEGVDPSRSQFDEWDDAADGFFVSPVLLDDPSPYEIYQRSLDHCEQKTSIRDYLDLYQALKSLGERNVDGAVVEFGSYRGHSGWLIAATLDALGQQRRVFMFDTFDSFPSETLGIDQFWNDSHPVDFEAVRARLAPFPNVTLVRGDFTETLARSDVGPVALAYVDCDSYRATHYLLDTIIDQHLVLGGMMVCEDYGHPALLGSRLAVHEALDGRPDLARFYSQFSGLYFAIKS